MGWQQCRKDEVKLLVSAKNQNVQVVRVESDLWEVKGGLAQFAPNAFILFHILFFDGGGGGSAVGGRWRPMWLQTGPGQRAVFFLIFCSLLNVANSSCHTEGQ